MAGTEQLKTDLWLPTLDRLRLAPIAPIVALIIRQALDLEPLPSASTASAPAATTRFARPSSYWAERAKEDGHELH